MIDSIPSETPEQKKRVEGLKKLVPEKVAPFVVALCADEARDGFDRTAVIHEFAKQRTEQE